MSRHRLTRRLVIRWDGEMIDLPEGTTVWTTGETDPTCVHSFEVQLYPRGELKVWVSPEDIRDAPGTL